LAKGEPIISTFYEIGRDLLNLEVNTIEKPNLTARKMPVLPHALLDIAEYYLNELTKNLDLTSFWELSKEQRSEWHPQYKQPGESTDWKQLPITNGAETFDKLRWAAARTLWSEEVQDHFDESELVILYRIRRNCDQLKNIIYDLRKQDHTWNDLLDERTRLDLLTEKIRYLPMGKLPVDYAIAVRKIWDIGTETVFMQTLIQIDGDVVTRIQRGLPKSKQKLILRVHERGVDVSMRYWETLFGIVKQIAGGLTELFLPRPPMGK
jgi:hypothetical protein